MTSPANRCFHCQCPLSDGQTTCLACGSRCATMDSWYAEINARLKAEGRPPIDPDAAAKERAMYAQQDAQRAEAKRLAAHGPPALELSVNDRAPRGQKARAILHLERGAK